MVPPLLRCQGCVENEWTTVHEVPCLEPGHVWMNAAFDMGAIMPPILFLKKKEGKKMHLHQPCDPVGRAPLKTWAFEENRLTDQRRIQPGPTEARGRTSKVCAV